MRTTSRCALALLVVLPVVLTGRPAAAETPQLSRVSPSGAERGTLIEITLSGARLKDAQSLFLYKPGLEVLHLGAATDTSLKVCLSIADDCPLGEHPLRIRTSTGISELRTFWVGPFPVADEVEPNSEFAKPQKIEFEHTVAGLIQNEDVDYFSVSAKKGQRITAEVEGIRLGVALFDPYVAILDTKRFELASSDDTALLLQDPTVSLIAPEDGTYVIQVRESSYGGGENGSYRLHVGTFPRPLAVYPAGGKAGETLDATFVGDVKGPIRQSIALAVGRSGRVPVFACEDGRMPPSPNYLRISDYPNVLEAEPNNDRAQATKTDLTLPVALNGIIQAKGDQDWFRFKATKGQSFEIRCHARSVRSPLDAILSVWQAGGAQIASNDDQGGLDPVVRFSASADGEYEVRVADHLGNGGPAYVYRVEFSPAQPSVFTHIPAYDREPRGQTRQWVAVPKGNRFATWIRVNRTGYGGDMNLSFEGLPPGITALCDPIAAAVDRVPVVFEAGADAPVSGGLADVIATAADASVKLRGGFQQEVNLVLGNPNNTAYYTTTVDKLAVTVAEEVPFKIRIVEPKVPLVQNGSMELKVVAERKPGFDAAIALSLLWAPPGIGAGTNVAIAQGQTEAAIPLNAGGNSPARSWKIAVLGTADLPGGPAWVSSQLAALTVGAPYLSLKMEMTAVEQGQAGEIVCKLDVQKAFEGKAKVFLHGLPAAVVAEPAVKEVSKGDKEVEFAIKVDAKSPPGQHKGLFCQVVVMENGEPVAHNLGGGILRIDPPPPPKKNDTAKPGDTAAKSAETKRLSRLEQLRLEAEKAAKEGKGQ